MADGHLIFDTKIDEGGFNKGISKLTGLGKNGLSVVSKTMTGSLAAIGATTGAVVKSSFDVVANMEQLAGGVETLFKDSADTVIKNANRAYKTAQVSANDYMSTVTSFSASLLQSLGGDTAKAAEYADRALIDMADNANKMGTNMQDIQNAYQGFAKQNYTMLDNLKLGYGGTKTEMERLVSDASKMIDVQKELGVTVDANNLSFGNIINAISVVQKKLDIAGTSGKEALTTIEGSVNSAKAAWENFQGGVITSQEFVEIFGTAAHNILKNLGEITPRLGKTGLEVVSQIASKIGESVPAAKGFADAVGGITDKLGSMETDELMNLAKMGGLLVTAVPALGGIGKGMEVASAASSVFTGALSSVGNNVKGIPDKFKTAKKAISGIGSGLKALPGAITGPFDILTPKLSGSVRKIGSSVSSLAGKMVSPLGNIGRAVAGKFSGVTSAFSDFTGYLGAWGGNVGSALSGVLGNVGKFMPGFAKLMNFGLVAGVLVAGLGLLNTQFGEQINTILTTMQTKGPEVITNFCNGIVSALPNLIAQGGQILNNLMLAITANLPAIIQGGIAIVSTLITGIAQQLPTLIPTALNMILTLVMSLLSNVGQLVDAGINLLTGLADGIVNAIPILIEKAPALIGQLASAIISNLPKILQAGIQIVSKLAVGLIQAVPQLIGKIPAIISQIKSAFTSINWGDVGSNIIKGIANGLKGAASAIVEAAKSAAKSALDAAKDFLGIHSPSRVFRDEVGKMMALGMGIGFDKNVPIKSMNTSLKTAIGSLKDNAATVLSGGGLNSGGVGRAKALSDATDGIDYDRLERIQMKAADKMAKRPIYLDKNRIDKPLPKGAVPVW